jgi:hypothetical protein
LIYTPQDELDTKSVAHFLALPTDLQFDELGLKNLNNTS